MVEKLREKLSFEKIIIMKYDLNSIHDYCYKSGIDAKLERCKENQAFIFR
jgi:hypothetical protein